MTNCEEIFLGNIMGLSLELLTKIKIDHLKSIITQDTIYKFIQFDDNIYLNESKISSFLNETLWFSHHRFLNDPSEYKIQYDAKSICKKTGMSMSALQFAFGTLQDLYELCSFTYESNDYMWNTYSNKGNGICIAFLIKNYDMLFPVIYKDKNSIDFTKMIIESLNKNNKSDFLKVYDPIALLPYIIKNPINGIYDSKKEKEVRMLYAPTDKSEFNNGILYPNAKEELKFNGIYVSHKELQISIKSIIIGDNCNPHIQELIEKICIKKGISFTYQ